MPFYEYRCPDHGVFTEMMPMADMQESMPCEACGEAAPKIVSAFSNISTSDDPSFGSGAKAWSGNKEFGGFDADTKHGWAERPTHSKSDWEYA